MRIKTFTIMFKIQLLFDWPTEKHLNKKLNFEY
jgi:hypothetical protein